MPAPQAMPGHLRTPDGWAPIHYAGNVRKTKAWTKEIEARMQGPFSEMASRNRGLQRRRLDEPQLREFFRAFLMSDESFLDDVPILYCSQLVLRDIHPRPDAFVRSDPIGVQAATPFHEEVIDRAVILLTTKRLLFARVGGSVSASVNRFNQGSTAKLLMSITSADDVVFHPIPLQLVEAVRQRETNEEQGSALTEFVNAFICCCPTYNFQDFSFYPPRRQLQVTIRYWDPLLSVPRAAFAELDTAHCPGHVVEMVKVLSKVSIRNITKEHTKKPAKSADALHG